MPNFKKILIINNIIVLSIIFLTSLFLWLQKERVTPIAVPAGFSGQGIPSGFLGGEIIVTDSKQGNSGDVQLTVNKTKKPVEISWPAEYVLYSLTLKALGTTEKIDDNKIIWSFTTDKPQFRLFPKAGPVIIERAKIEPPVSLDKILNNKEIRLVDSLGAEVLKEGRKYAVEALFEKEGEDKVYTGLYGFTY